MNLLYLFELFSEIESDADYLFFGDEQLVFGDEPLTFGE